MALELHGQLRQLIHAHAGRVRPRGHHKPAVGAGLEPLAGCWKLQILDEIDPTPAMWKQCEALHIMGKAKFAEWAGSGAYTLKWGLDEPPPPPK